MKIIGWLTSGARPHEAHGSELPEQRIRIEERNGARRVIVPVRREWYRILLNSVWLAVLGAFAAGLLIALTGRMSSELVPGALARAGLIAVFMLSTAAALLLVWRIVWSLGGSEEFRMDGGTLVLSRRIGKTAFWYRRYPLERVEDLRASPLRYTLFYPAWGRAFVNHEEHEVTFRVGRGRAHVARGLSRGEAEQLRELLRVAIAQEA